MRTLTLTLAVVSMLMAHSAAAREEPPAAAEAPSITSDRPSIVDLVIVAEADCAEFAEAALEGNAQAVHHFLNCID